MTRFPISTLMWWFTGEPDGLPPSELRERFTVDAVLLSHSLKPTGHVVISAWGLAWFPARLLEVFPLPWTPDLRVGCADIVEVRLLKVSSARRLKVGEFEVVTRHGTALRFRCGMADDCVLALERVMRGDTPIGPHRPLGPVGS